MGAGREGNMELLWEVLDHLISLFCWLCSKREAVQARLDYERTLKKLRPQRKG